MNNETVVKLVSDALRKFSDDKLGTELLIDTKALRYDKSDDWWYVPVKPANQLKRIYDFYDVLAQAEEELQSHDQKIALVPA